jgi:uncharacterized membrane protein YphA (DoxX/SURF4 family)
MPWMAILRWVMIVAWFVHGIATLANVISTAGVNIGFPNRPPIVGILVGSPLRYVAASAWLVVSVGYVAAAVGLILGTAWWPVAAWVSASVSIVMILLYWRGVPAGERYGGQLVNLATIVYLVVGPK